MTQYPMKLGRLAPDMTRLALAPSLQSHRFATMMPPNKLDRSNVNFSPRLFQNDTLPDCTAAALANAAMGVAGINGFELAVDDVDVPAFYADCIGMAGASDAVLAGTAGAVALDVLSYQSHVGFGVGEQVALSALWGVVTPIRPMLAGSMARLGAGYWGVLLTDGDMEAAANGAVWDAPPGVTRGQIVGGHMVCGWDYDGLGDTSTVRIATWGGFRLATWRWVLSRIEEAYGLIWRQLTATNGLDIGVDIGQLEAELSNFG